ncbi:MAG: septation regulator SpoVG [Clostridia bacterium]|nr:septation regulator SpoVG [Clostridia bacterium]
MKITDIRIRKVFDNGPMKAVVSVTFDEQFAVHDIKVIDAGGKNFIVMPSRKNADGTYRDVAHPINAQFRTELEQAVMEVYNSTKARDDILVNTEE